MAVSALGVAGGVAGLELLAGLFGYLAGEEIAGAAESRARMIRMEADADATRYAEQARGFQATQKLAFLKAGVTLEGSPLDILDETVRVSAENISAIRAGGEARALGAKWEGAQARIGGRNALIGGALSGFGRVSMAAYMSGGNQIKSETPRNDTGVGYTSAKRTVY